MSDKLGEELGVDVGEGEDVDEGKGEMVVVEENDKLGEELGVGVELDEDVDEGEELDAPEVEEKSTCKAYEVVEESDNEA
ncbi:hypothetical protein EYC94_26160 [Enterobacter hormaechei]|nr:hypothetical protein EYC94_26160 [Enterobacter hormaechei]